MKKASVGQKWAGLATLVIAGTFALSACNNDDNNNTPQLQTINELVTAGDRFTLLEAAVARAGLGTTLSQPGPFTVFAPSDDAFRAAGFADVAAINAAPDTTLRRILQYHVISGTAIPASAITAGQTAQPTSLSTNGTLYITRAGSTSASGGSAISVNGARILSADGQASNGVIHAIDRVLMPARGNVLQIAQADTSLSLLVAAAVRGGATVTSALGGTTPLTVFAPTNAAFRAIGFTRSVIDTVNVARLTSVLTNHVVANARAYSPTVASGPITTFGGGSVTATVGSNNAITLLSRGNGTNAANVTTADINATNGVIHKIDRVLLP
ncbi:fasciclin domain-containing protein [Spirosoma fluminis]